MFNPLNNQKYLKRIKTSQPHEKHWVVILENISLFLGNNLSLLRKSEETLLFGGNAEFIDVNQDGKI